MLSLFLILVVAQTALLVAYVSLGREALKSLDPAMVGECGVSRVASLWWPFLDLFHPSAKPLTNAGKVIFVAALGTSIELLALAYTYPLVELLLLVDTLPDLR